MPESIFYKVYHKYMPTKPLILLGGGGRYKLEIDTDHRHIARHDDEKEVTNLYPLLSVPYVSRKWRVRN